MADPSLKILIADDDEGDRRQVRRALKRSGFACTCVEAASVEDALAACDKVVFDGAIIDYNMPGRDGLLGVEALHERLPFMAIIMVTGHGDESVATEAMKRGASDYIAKNQLSSESIRRALDNSLEKTALRRKVAEQREELESFASVLAHDLKSPITSILAFARIIEQSLLAEAVDNNKVIDYCRRVVSAGRRLDAMIDTLREYTRADGHVTFGPVEMGQVMEDMLSNLDHVIRARGARVTYAWLPVVTGNSSQLTQLLQNLVGNAIKYCEAAVPTVDIAASPGRGDAWLFAVKDNGIGIPEESYRRVFEPFKRLDEAGKYEGTGLGLATCKKIVERHGDVIWCKSSEEGTTFFFTLPAAGAVAESLSSRSVRPTLEESSHADSKTGPLKKG